MNLNVRTAFRDGLKAVKLGALGLHPSVLRACDAKGEALRVALRDGDLTRVKQHLVPETIRIAGSDIPVVAQIELYEINSAIRTFNPEILKVVVDADANPAALNVAPVDSFYPPLHFLAKFTGSVSEPTRQKMAQILLDAGANINEEIIWRPHQYPEGLLATPAFIATVADNWEFSSFLQSRGGLIHMPSRPDRIPTA
jgi:hypothetical protein